MLAMAMHQYMGIPTPVAQCGGGLYKDGDFIFGVLVGVSKPFPAVGKVQAASGGLK